MSVFFTNRSQVHKGVLGPTLQQHARECRDEGIFNDFVVIAGDETINANSMVLACHSNYFKQMFKTNMKEKQSYRVRIEKEQGAAVKAIIDYFYTEVIEINNENVMDLLSASDYLQVDGLKKPCFDYLKSNLSSENSIPFLSAANLYGESTLTDQIFKFISENFENVSQTHEFKSLPTTDFLACLSKLKQQYQTQSSSIYWSFITWVKHDKEERQHKFARLFEELVDLKRLSIDFIENVLLRENLITLNSKCYNQVLSALPVLRAKGDLFSKSNPSKIISLGGYRTRQKVLEVFHLHKPQTLLTYPDLPSKIHSHCALKIKDSVLCIGGETSQSIAPNKPTNAVWQLNLNDPELRWKKVDSITEKRSQMAATVHQNGIVVVGGYIGRNRVNLPEFYQPELNKWESIFSVEQARRKLALVSCEGYLYALGGYSNTDLTNSTASTERSRDLDGDWNTSMRIIPPASSAQRLRVLNGNWENIEPMQTPRCEFAAVNCDNIIYAIGGRSHRSPGSTLKSVETYDFAADSWKYVEEMSIERSGHSACVLEGKIYVVGGCNAEDKAVTEIECYDPFQNKWDIVGQVNDELYYHSIVAV